MTHKRIALAGIALVVASCSGKSITRSDDPAAGGTESGQSGASSTSGSSAVGTGGSTSSGNGGSASFEGCACAVDSYTAVCGVDGITYDVACGRHCIGVEIACDGECPCAGAGGSNSGSGGSSAGGSGAGGSSAGGSSGVDCGCQLGAYFPVCGMDGQTYDATCGIECVPEPVDCYGECPCTSCNSLSFRYQQALARASPAIPSSTTSSAPKR